eukprot:COSAG01_NODE_42428_length_440_cov_0.765396_2_plen_42_part_01
MTRTSIQYGLVRQGAPELKLHLEKRGEGVRGGQRNDDADDDD